MSSILLKRKNFKIVRSTKKYAAVSNITENHDKSVASRLAPQNHVQYTNVHQSDRQQRVLKDTKADQLNKKRPATYNDDTTSKRRRLEDSVDNEEQDKLDAIAAILKGPARHKLEAISELLEDDPRAPVFDDNDGIDRCAYCGWEITYDWDQGDEHYKPSDDDEKDIEPFCEGCGKECKYNPDDWVTTDDEAGLKSEGEFSCTDDSGDEEDYALIDDTESLDEEEEEIMLKQESDDGQLNAVSDDEESSVIGPDDHYPNRLDQVVDDMAEDHVNEDDAVRVRVEEALSFTQSLQENGRIVFDDELSVDDMVEKELNEVDDDGLPEAELFHYMQTLPGEYKGTLPRYRVASEEL